MSVRAGRVFLGITAAVFVGSVIWFVVASMLYGAISGASAAPIAVTVAALVGFGVGAMMFARFAEAHVEAEQLIIRRVLGAPRRLPIAGIDTMVVVEDLHLPSRSGAASVLRLVLRAGDRTLLAFTPSDGGLVQRLSALGIPMETFSEPVTPRQLAQRYPGSVSPAERAISALPWLALVIGVVAVGWVCWEALHR
ncbi:hypothetical protein ACWGJP_14800 [Microbacterium sp. NPDC055903]